MSTFFSATDTGTLREEGIDRNHFVSLIVNNEGTYTAAITRKVKSTKTIIDSSSYNTFGNEIIDYNKEYISEEEIIEWFYLDIEFEGKNSFQESLKDRLEELKKIKESKNKKTPGSTRVFTTPNNNYPWKDANIVQGDLFKDRQSFKNSTNKTGNSKSSSQCKTTPIRDYYENYEVSKTDYELIPFDKQILRSLVLQLITGSVVLPNESKIDPNKWVQGMVPIFEKRFGKGEEGLKLFTVWADGYIDFLCWYTMDEDLLELGFDDEEMSQICAYNLINELDKLPSNKYIECYINLLYDYIR